MDPVGATACIREARLVVCPIGVYSTWPTPVVIERTTTSPVFAPTRASIGIPPSATTFVEYRRISSCMRSAAYNARCGWSSCATGAPNNAKMPSPVDCTDVAVVATHCLDHEMQRRIDDRTRLLGIEVLHQFHRA